MKKYNSQYNQDKLVDFLLKKNNGIFIDIGANDGVSYSNSYFFEKERNWKGICIEPILETFKDLTKIRECTCLNIGVWSEKKTLKFYRANGYAEMLSGIVDSFSQDHFNRLKSDIETSGGSLETIEIDVLPLNYILDEQGIKDVDFCSIDTEGSEYEILKAIDFNNYHFRVFAIENNYHLQNIRELLQQKGYCHLTRLGGDDIFISKKETSKLKLRFLYFRINQKIESVQKRLFKRNKFDSLL